MPERPVWAHSLARLCTVSNANILIIALLEQWDSFPFPIVLVNGSFISTNPTLLPKEEEEASLMLACQLEWKIGVHLSMMLH